MAQIVAKTKQWIETEHSEMEKTIPTELLVQDGKLYLARDGVALSGQEGQPLIQGEKGEPGEPGAKGDKGDPGASGGVELYQYSFKVTISYQGNTFILYTTLFSQNNYEDINANVFSTLLNETSGGAQIRYMCNGYVNNGTNLVGLPLGIVDSFGNMFITYLNLNENKIINTAAPISTSDITECIAHKIKLLGVTATLATITQDAGTGDITIVTPD